jgi:hypothetical protein
VLPQKKADEPSKGAAECILKIGKNSNVVQWKEEIQNELSELYGLTRMFFTQTRGMYNHFLVRKIIFPISPNQMTRKSQWWTTRRENH